MQSSPVWSSFPLNVGTVNNMSTPGPRLSNRATKHTSECDNQMISEVYEHNFIKLIVLHCFCFGHDL